MKELPVTDCTMPILSEQEKQELISFAKVISKDWGNAGPHSKLIQIALAALMSTPVVHEAEINGVMSSVTKSHFDDCEKYGIKTRKLYTVPPVPVKQEGEQ